MKMKRVFGIASVVGGLFMSALPICADEQSGSTQLNANVDATYMLTIPQATTIPYGKTTMNISGYLKVAGNVNAGQTIKVSAAVTPLHNAAQNTDIPYTIKKADAAFSTDTWSEDELRSGLANDEAGKKDQLSIAIDEASWNSAKAGSYTGSIVFTAELK